MKILDWINWVMAHKNDRVDIMEFAVKYACIQAEAERCVNDLVARSKQMWENLRFKKEFFSLMLRAKTALKRYPPYKIWHIDTAKYADRSVIDKEWQESNLRLLTT